VVEVEKADYLLKLFQFQPHLDIHHLTTSYLESHWQLNALHLSLQVGMLVICEYAIAYFGKKCKSHIFPHIMAFSKSHMRKIRRIC